MRRAVRYFFGVLFCTAVFCALQAPAECGPVDSATTGIPDGGSVTVDVDEERFERGVPASFILIGFPSGAPTARMESVFHEGHGALSFSYERGSRPVPVLVHHVCLEGLTRIGFRVLVEKETFWVVNIGDLDGARFSAHRVISPGGWTDVTFEPSDFSCNEDSPVRKERIDPANLGFGYAAFDLFSLTEKRDSNRVLIDDVKVTRAAVSVIDGDYVLSAENRRITQNTRITGDLVLKKGAELVVTAERFRVDGDILVKGASLSLGGGAWTFSQDYRYHHGMRVKGGGTIELNNGRLDLIFPYGAGVESGGSVLVQNVRVVSGLFTFGLQTGGTLRLEGCENFGEIIAYRGGKLHARDCKSLLLWLNLERGADADLNLPDGSRLERLTLPEELGREIVISDCGGVLWGVIAESGSSLTVRESRLRAVGLHFTGRERDTVSGFQNGRTYPKLVYRSKSHNLHLYDTKVDTWNFYASGRAELEIRDSVFGESLSFDRSAISIYDSVCDGSGGYLGARGDSSTLFVRGEIACDVLANDNGSITVTDCGRIGGRVEAAGMSRIVILHTLLNGAVAEIDAGTVEIR